MYVEGTTDLMGLIGSHIFLPADAKEKNMALIIERATTRYFPVYEKVSDRSSVVCIDSEVGTGSPSTPLLWPHLPASGRQVTIVLELYDGASIQQCTGRGTK